MVAEPSVIYGIIGGAPYQIAVPPQPTGNILIHAHGYRPMGPPRAELELENTAHGEMVANGWIVATSAFRRNGMIIRDAMEDLMLLRNHIEEVYGPLTLVILEGQSMGGAIVTHLAERHPDLFNGAIAIGAALQSEDQEDPIRLAQDPKIPVLFLTNRSEIAGPRAYVEATKEAPVPPVLWKIERDGHVNVNQTERLLAIDALVSWTTTGNIDANRDITVEIEILDSTVQFNDSGAIGRVIDITHNHGNVFIDFGPADFDRLDIANGNDFRLIVGGVAVTVRYGTTFSDVHTGDWIAFPTADGDTIVAINFGSAFEHLNLAIGDEVRVETINPAGK
jgi:pimeloyl-ACP methyl ester carboxylesterase